MAPEKPLKKFDGIAAAPEIHLYQRKVGSIGYPASITRPDSARVPQKLSGFLQSPSNDHQNMADQNIAYLCSTRNFALEFGAVYSDNPNNSPFQLGIQNGL